MSLETTTIARRIFEEVFNTGDVARVDDFAAADFVANYAGAVPVRGLAAYKDLFARDLPSFPDARYTIEDLFGEGEKVAIRWRMEATHQGTYQGIAPTGRRVTLQGATDQMQPEIPEADDERAVHVGPDPHRHRQHDVRMPADPGVGRFDDRAFLRNVPTVIARLDSLEASIDAAR